MLKVVIDVTPVTPKQSGVGFYVINLIRSLYALQKEDIFNLEIIYQPLFKNWVFGNLYFPESLQPYSDLNILPIPVRISDIVIFNPYLKPALSYFQQYFGSPDIVHGTNYSVYPLTNSLKVMNIYDLTFIKYPNYVDSVVKTYTKKITRCLQWTDLILTISESSKQDIVKYLQVNPEKVYVTPLGSRYHANYISPEVAEKLKLEAKYDFSKPYLLFVSTIEPRKNINSIITAFNLLKQNYKIEHQLVLIGKKAGVTNQYLQLLKVHLGETKFIILITYPMN
jgi:glycosyltransferase involved in cell wall biosynthesis